VSATPTILVVEDNALNLKLVRDVLRHAGFHVVEATTGEEGVRLAEEVDPDLVLMDLQLPGIDGTEALRRLRSSDRHRSVPVVALTAFAMDGDRQRAEQDGFDDYIEKPVRVRVLPDQVRRLLVRDGDDGA
jgi:two-component system, cell cycle response regulator DivK